MADLFEDFNNIVNKELILKLINKLKDPDNKFSENLNKLLNDRNISFNDILEKYIYNQNYSSKDVKKTDLENLSEREKKSNKDYEELFIRLRLIEENMINMENYLKSK